jgi:hypothetical protein
MKRAKRCSNYWVCPSRIEATGQPEAKKEDVWLGKRFEIKQ